jgi:cytidylate kinase
MDCTSISISRSLAAGGEEVARAVAQKTGFRLVDDEIIATAADRAGVSPVTIARVERSPSLIDRILKHLGNTPIEAGHGAYVPIPSGDNESYEGIIGDVIREVANEGKAVILAHGGSIALAGNPGVFRVLVTGSPQERAARYAQETGMKDGDCRKAIEKSDRERADFLLRFYDVEQESPAHYDLVISTDRISPEEAAGLVVQAAGRIAAR